MYNEPSVSNADFFGRPITIYESTWSSATTTVSAGYLYNFYLNNAAVLRKIYGYSRMRFTMHLRFEFHPTAFHFGQLLLGVESMYGTGGYQLVDSTLGFSYLLMHNPHVILNAAAPAVHELQLPFSQPTNYLALNYAATLGTTQQAAPANVGPYLCGYAISALGFSNAAAVPSVGVTVRAWLTDVELVGPTGVAPFSQSAVGSFPEIGSKGPISTTLAAVGDGLEAARRRAPFLGSMLQPFHGLAAFGAGVAAMFGLSTPPDVRAPMPVIERRVSSYALCDVPNSSNQVTFSSTAGTTPSGDNVGTSGEDEMHLATFIQHMSHLGRVSWTIAGVKDDVLLALPVSPRFVDYDGTTWMVPTSLWYAAACFRKWRGSIIYTITVAASPQHRGRLRILYEPVSASRGSEPVGQRFNCILDLDAARSIDVSVAWSSENTWLDHPLGTTMSTTTNSPCAWTAFSNTFNAYADNGSIIMYIEAPLTAPQATNNDVIIDVAIRGGPDFMLAQPDLKPIQYWTPVTNQSATGSFPNNPATTTSTSLVAGPQVCYLNGPPVFNEKVVLLGAHESPISLRALAKRFCLYQELYPSTGYTGNGVVYNSYTTNVWPATSFVKDAVAGCANSLHPSAGFISWFAPCYKFSRGSVRWRVYADPWFVNVTTATQAQAATGVSPRLLGYATATYGVTSATTVPPRLALLQMANGGAVADQGGVLDITIPIYCDTNAVINRAAMSSNALGNNGYTQWSLIVDGGSISAATAQLQMYVAAGDDFSFMGYIGPPPLKLRGAVP